MTTDQVETVAVIGLGEMGAPKARHLLDAGFDVRVYDVRPSAMDPLVEAGAHRCQSPAAAVDGADASLVVVLTEAQVWDVLLGTDADPGVVSAAPADHLVIVSSTISPMACVAMAERLSEDGIRFVDAPTARGGEAAERGDLLVFVGADAEDLVGASQVIGTHAAAEDIFHIGPVGHGAVAKAVNNAILFSTVVANFESLRLAAAFGVDLDILRPALIKGSADNFSLRIWDWQHLKTADKDLDMALAMAADRDVPVPLVDLARARVDELTVDDLDAVR